MIKKITTHAVSYVGHFNGVEDPEYVTFEICLPVVTPENLAWALRLNECDMCGLSMDDTAEWRVINFTSMRNGKDVCFTAISTGLGPRDEDNFYIGGVVSAIQR